MLSRDITSAFDELERVEFAACRFGALPSCARGPIDDLRQAIAAIPPYDGLIANLPGHLRRHVFRDPALLVIGPRHRRVQRGALAAGS